MNSNKTYEFNDDIWKEIMSYTAPQIESVLDKWGIDKLHNLYKKTQFRKFINMKASSIPLQERRNVLLRPLMRFHFKHNLYNYIETKLSVGDMVIWNRKVKSWGDYDVGGTIIKVNKNTYTVQFYRKIEVDDVSGLCSWEDKIPTYKKTVSYVKKVDDYWIRGGGYIKTITVDRNGNRKIYYR